ncbi:PadR family transcriptional regulator [Halalkalicoccus sp. NIPERK01]|uniref:PadR family transcriptional regulator n=1 Tax=Halalkalicoccus sp. NIPERK01 TaxID=3053469 RepID=UPI00256E9FFF|nr:helix-turn-helix transcriptional regulator [Halalkalicoccus sp. NIPERK01]MDL5361320.1 helix-turn-helix transcriptional regulator [Halalkalicoccus sp. NIPERK01]
MNELTRFQIDMLVAIDGLDDPCGLDVKRVLEAEYGKEVAHGRLYPGLDSLVDRGLVEKESGSVDGRTNTYRLADGGRQALDARRRWIGRAEERDRDE